MLLQKLTQMTAKEALRITKLPLALRSELYASMSALERTLYIIMFMKDVDTNSVGTYAVGRDFIFYRWSEFASSKVLQVHKGDASMKFIQELCQCLEEYNPAILTDAGHIYIHLLVKTPWPDPSLEKSL